MKKVVILALCGILLFGGGIATANLGKPVKVESLSKEVPTPTKKVPTATPTITPTIVPQAAQRTQTNTSQVAEIGKKIKTKYPQYAHISDEEVGYAYLNKKQNFKTDNSIKEIKENQEQMESDFQQACLRNGGSPVGFQCL